MGIKLLVSIAFALSSGAQGAMQGPAHSPKTALASGCNAAQSVADRFVRDMKAKRLDDVLFLYTEDAVFSQPDGTRVVGRDALRKMYMTTFATYDSELSLGIPQRGLPSSDPTVCVQTGQYHEDLRLRKNGTTMKIHGRYQISYRNTGNNHCLITDMRWTVD